MMKTAVYPGRFDPFTLGHLDIIERASKQFDRCIIAMAEIFEPHWENKVRLDLVKKSIAHLENVSVEMFSGLLVDFIRSHDAHVVIRGMRNVDDFNDEYRMSVMNRQILPDCDTIFLLSSPEVSVISATLVREIMHRSGQIHPFVPKPVADYYEQSRGA